MWLAPVRADDSKGTSIKWATVLLSWVMAPAVNVCRHSMYMLIACCARSGPGQWWAGMASPIEKGSFPLWLSSPCSGCVTN